MIENPFSKEVRIPFLNSNTTRYRIQSYEPAEDGSVHNYMISAYNLEGEQDLRNYIHFQEGALNDENQNHNGLLSVVYLQVLIDHLKSFQQGKFPTRETALAITDLESAYNWLARRSDERASRGVLGNYKA